MAKKRPVQTTAKITAPRYSVRPRLVETSPDGSKRELTLREFSDGIITNRRFAMKCWRIIAGELWPETRRDWCSDDESGSHVGEQDFVVRWQNWMKTPPPYDGAEWDTLAHKVGVAPHALTEHWVRRFLLPALIAKWQGGDMADPRWSIPRSPSDWRKVFVRLNVRCCSIDAFADQRKKGIFRQHPDSTTKLVKLALDCLPHDYSDQIKV